MGADKYKDIVGGDAMKEDTLVEKDTLISVGKGIW